MKRHISIFAFLLSAIQVLAADVFVFSSHKTSITDAAETPTAFDIYSEDTQGYSDGWLPTGFTTLTCSQGYPLIAGTSEDKEFIGWYSKDGGWKSYLDDVTVSSADKCISTSTQLNWNDITDGAGRYDNSAWLVVAKYVSLYKIEAEVVPAGAGTVSGTNTYEEGKSVSLKASANSGYAFKAWSTNNVVLSSSPELNFTAAKGCAGTYTASFTGKVYTVEFAKGDGEGGEDEVLATFGSAMPQLKELPHRFGYDFGGYFDEQDGKGVQYYAADGTSVHVWDKAREFTLHAYWKPQVAQLRLRFDKGEIKSIGYRTGQSGWITVMEGTDVDVQVGVGVWAYGVPKDGYEMAAYDYEHPWSETMQQQGWTFSPETKKAKVYYTVTFTDPSGTYEDQSARVEHGGTVDTPPNWTRRGYATPSWDKPLGPITATTTITAVWTPNPYVIAFDGNGGAGEMEDLAAFYGEEIALTPNAFTKGILTFLHWTATVDGKVHTFADGEVVSNLTDVALGTNTLSAVWGEDYLVEFDANGATSGTMQQQRFVRNVSQSLSSNAYLRTGHTFLGWAINREKAVQEKVAYTNMQEVVNLAAVGTTNVLFATWSTNRFTVVFDRNGGSGTMNDQTISYGHGQTLDKCSFTRPAPWEFTGWLDEATGLTYDDEAQADTLSTEDGATVVLKAQWKMEVGELSEAMDCTNLKWNDGDYKGGKTGWTVCSGRGYESDSCVWHKADSGDAIMHARIYTPGKLTFRWQPTSGELLSVYVKLYNADKTDASDRIFKMDLSGQDGEWGNPVVELVVPSDDPRVDFDKIVMIEINSLNFGQSCETYVDEVIWTPEGGEPEYDENDTTVDSFSMADGKLVFAFDATNDETSAYHLLGTNDLVAPMPWPMILEIGKPSGPFSFEIPVKEDEPKMFYRIRALK